MITIKLYAYLRQGRGKVAELDYSEGMTIGHAIRRLDIDENQIQVILISGKRKALSHVLKDKTVISLFPPIAGG